MSDTPKWTPGPWAVEYNGSYGPFINCTRAGDPDYGAAAHDVGHETHSIATPHGPNAKANARLIAAAPDLYAALSEVEWLGTYQGMSACPYCMKRADKKQHAEDCILAAALRKARGEA